MYTLDDARTLPLPEDVRIAFIKRMLTYLGLPVVRAAEHPTVVQYVIDYALSNSYKTKLSYLLAENSVERAKAAANGPREAVKQEVLDIWLDCISKMSGVEKLLLGWDKV